MFVRVQAHEMKPIMNCYANEDMVNGAPAAYTAYGKLAKANAETKYIVVSAENFDGINACIEPTDADHETIKAGALCLRFPMEVGDVIATDQITATGLNIGDALVPAAGKFVKSESATAYVYGGAYENPWGLDMHRVECI